jgi:hypothetical protein
MAVTFESFVRVGVLLLNAYVLAGLLFAVGFLAFGITRIDEEAKGASIGFRFVIAPGVVIFWPTLLVRWIRGTEPAVERNAHRCSAR